MMKVKSLSGSHGTFCMCGTRSMPIGYWEMV